MPVYKALATVGLLVTLIVLATNPAMAGWERYKAGTLAGTPAGALVDRLEGSDPASGPKSDIVTPGIPVKATVIFTGESRRTSDDHMRLMGMWSETLGKKKSIAPMFQTEIRVEENGTSYWVPVQNPVLPFIGREVQKGGAFRIMALWIGRITGDNVFVVNEFETGDNRLPGSE